MVTSSPSTIQSLNQPTDHGIFQHTQVSNAFDNPEKTTYTRPPPEEMAITERNVRNTVAVAVRNTKTNLIRMSFLPQLPFKSDAALTAASPQLNIQLLQKRTTSKPMANNCLPCSVINFFFFFLIAFFNITSTLTRKWSICNLPTHYDMFQN